MAILPSVTLAVNHRQWYPPNTGSEYFQNAQYVQYNGVICSWLYTSKHFNQDVPGCNLRGICVVHSYDFRSSLCGNYTYWHSLKNTGLIGCDQMILKGLIKYTKGISWNTLGKKQSQMCFSHAGLPSTFTIFVCITKIQEEAIQCLGFSTFFEPQNSYFTEYLAKQVDQEM